MFWIRNGRGGKGRLSLISDVSGMIKVVGLGLGWIRVVKFGLNYVGW